MTRQNHQDAVPTHGLEQQTVQLEQPMVEETQKQDNSSSTDWAAGIDISQIIELGSEVVDWVGEALSDISIDL